MDDIPLVRLLSMALSGALEELHEGLARAGHADLRPAEGYALNAIAAGSDTASALAASLGMTKQGAAKLLRGLVTSGYVEEGADPADGRRHPFGLTDRGRSAVAESVRLQRAIQARWEAESGQSAVHTLREVLGRALPAAEPGRMRVRPWW